MNIGEAASRSGVSAKMIRHYESLGLIRPERRSNNYRSYTDQTISLLRFIRHARDLAFPLAEVKSILALWGDDKKGPEELRSSAMGHVEALEEKAHSMRAMAQALRDLADTIDSREKPEAPRFEAA
ncbi:MerR family transcriptional regulator [Sabulicella glaciei]|uniref:MerR family transcriptional regulator n=1 Tax=Sabulicella glaciei TaxID=2984948 RepID=A0ABT3NTY1_9PROT|nr:MerR family transcriptional regulator [Roseococcus sp. MDT2-1-1]MCW8085610.1 MerR family transcriptional regulator [Roseococcus sp. MDT2-1-1]